jgi:hypothetical protein
VTGIPPDVVVPVYPEDEVAAGRDAVLETSLERLGVKRPASGPAPSPP